MTSGAFAMTAWMSNVRWTFVNVKLIWFCRFNKLHRSDTADVIIISAIKKSEDAREKYVDEWTCFDFVRRWMMCKLWFLCFTAYFWCCCLYFQFCDFWYYLILCCCCMMSIFLTALIYREKMKYRHFRTSKDFFLQFYLLSGNNPKFFKFE